MAVKLPNKKPPAAKPPAKPAKEKVVKPKKEVIKPGKPVKPDPTAKAKVIGHQPGVVRGITYYKAAKTSDDHREGESFQPDHDTLRPVPVESHPPRAKKNTVLAL